MVQRRDPFDQRFIGRKAPVAAVGRSTLGVTMLKCLLHASQQSPGVSTRVREEILEKY